MGEGLSCYTRTTCEEMKRGVECLGEELCLVCVSLFVELLSEALHGHAILCSWHGVGYGIRMAD